MPTDRPSSPGVLVRHVRSDVWENRVFYATPCRFFIDVPVDMTGCILGALREARDRGLRRREEHAIYATDALYRGAILLEIDEPLTEASAEGVVRLDRAELLSRALPTRGVRLRAELDELVRWAIECGHEVGATYVEYVGAGPLMRPKSIHAAIFGGPSPYESARRIPVSSPR